MHNYFGYWGMIYNPNSKPIEFDGFKKQAGLISFFMTPKKWIETTAALRFEVYMVTKTVTKIVTKVVTRLVP